MKINPDDFEEWGELEGKGGGGGGKKDKRQGGKTVEAIGGDAKKNQLKNVAKTRKEGEKSPVDEVQEVVDYVTRQDEGSAERKNLTRYIEWLKTNFGEVDGLDIEDEMGNWEQMTASVKAGGGGRQTSRNARARTHLITGIRATAEESRQGAPNEEIVMKKIIERLRQHLNNWRTLMLASQSAEDRKKSVSVELGRLEEEVLRMVEGKR